MSTRLPTVSIVVPTRDRAGWLPRALDSVLAQDYPEVELLVVDDGSRDETADVLAEYARSHPPERFRFVAQANTGQAEAVNRGWALARGEIVGYLADDDALLPSAVSHLTDALRSDPAASVAYPAYHVVDERGMILDTVMPIEHSPEAAVRLHDTVIGPGALVRRSALDRAGAWDPSLRWMVDLILWVKLALQGRAVRVPHILASWTKHSGATTVQLSRAHALEHVQVARIGLSLLPPQPPQMRAEALRNACVHAAIFAGGSWSGDRFTVIDLHRPLISGRAAGDPATVPGSAGVEMAALWRRAADEIDRTPGGGTSGGLARLRAFAGDETVSADDLRVGLLQAAVDFGADTDPGGTRFAVFDAEAGVVPSPEIARFAKRALLGLPLSFEDLRAALERPAGLPA